MRAPEALLTATVNRELKQHARRVYSRQMSEHVVEQIDNFYWTSGARDVDADGPSATSDLSADAPVSQSDDLTQDDVIAKLPSRWDTSADRPRPPSSRDVVPIDQDDYLSAVIRLQALSARRLTLQHRLNTYRTLLALLEPYRRPKENVQPNLVWRDSPLAPELARTRTLAIRVAGRVDEGRASGRFPEVQVPATADEDEDSGDVWRDDGQAKVKRVLESW